MNCFEFRRSLLADPRLRTHEQEQHLVQCAGCAELAREIEGFEARLEQAINVAVPDALAERVLLRHKSGARATRAWALGAFFAAALAAAVYLFRGAGGEREPVYSAAALGTGHPAVAAIAHVLADEPRMLAQARSVDPAAARAAFARLGLNLPAVDTAVLYFDRCPMTGGTGYHAVLHGPFGRVTLILVPERSLGPPVAVADRNRTAAVGRAPEGSYIAVADSLRPIRSLERLLL